MLKLKKYMYLPSTPLKLAAKKSELVFRCLNSDFLGPVA